MQVDGHKTGSGTENSLASTKCSLHRKVCSGVGGTGDWLFMTTCKASDPRLRANTQFTLQNLCKITCESVHTRVAFMLFIKKNQNSVVVNNVVVVYVVSCLILYSTVIMYQRPWSFFSFKGVQMKGGSRGGAAFQKEPFGIEIKGWQLGGCEGTTSSSAWKREKSQVSQPTLPFRPVLIFPPLPPPLSVSSPTQSRYLSPPWCWRQPAVCLTASVCVRAWQAGLVVASRVLGGAVSRCVSPLINLSNNLSSSPTPTPHHHQPHVPHFFIILQRVPMRERRGNSDNELSICVARHVLVPPQSVNPQPHSPPTSPPPHTHTFKSPLI